MKRSLLAYAALLFFCSSVFAQTKKIASGSEAEALVTGAEQVIIDSARSSISFVRLKQSEMVPEANHLQWLKGVALKTGPDYDLALSRIEKDQYGYTHYRYRELYKKILLEYGVYYVHAKGGRVVSANGEWYEGIEKTPFVMQGNYGKAEEAAYRYFKLRNGTTNLSLADKSLRIVKNSSGYHYCFRIELASQTPLKHAYLYVDAASGELINEVNRIQTVDVTGTATTAFNGNKTITTQSVSASNYRLRETSRGGGINTMNLNNGSNFASATDFTSTSNNWSASTTYNKSVFDGHYGLEKTYDYYYNTYGRNSYDNAGAAMNMYLHYSTGYNNAYWDGTEMVFGDGDGSTYLPFTPTDIVGHEMTHAVTEHSAGLVYQNESGALNESFSDIFGVTVDYYANPSTANFLEGEQSSMSGTPFRDMVNPKNTSQPDTYQGTYWVSPGGWDNGGVHTNSQVQNHWYYLLCQGGSGTNDQGNNFTISGIGMADAAKIAYRNLTMYLTPNSTYNDARTYAIQSATDIFGSCSNQVIQCTNAWYAVGVGTLFNNAVTANFTASQNYSCTTPVTINFTNQSYNGTSYAWTFGDGGTSAALNPSHTYTATGTYTIRLITNGTASCGNSDTLIQTNYISVTSTGAPVSACMPTQGNALTSYGITRVQLSTINNLSSNASEGYKDFTCTNQTTLTAGDPYALTVKTVAGSAENVKVWIDYNNDGQMNTTNEVVMSTTNTITTHAKVVNTSLSAVLNTPLRMRVFDDYPSATLNTSCQTHVYGQTEDYTVRFVANSQKPVANFFASQNIVNVGGTIAFTDSSIHAPTSWHWYFTGGTPATSTQQNPSVIYNATGTYQVKLVVSNSFGADSIVKISYITAVNSYNMCSNTSSNSTAGNIYDSGGPTGMYQNGENCSFVINPGCASSITLSFSQFTTESGFDVLTVYNGTTTASPVVGTFSGSSVPASVTANSGTMLLRFSTDGSVTYNGFAASWSSVISSTVAPVANFTLSTNTPPLQVAVQFTDQTTNIPNAWSWDFGDGGISTQANPTHAYATPGTKTVTLISSNCVSSDTVINVLTVQQAPNMIINPDTINVTVNCGDSIWVPVTIQNTGSGALQYISNGGSGVDTVRILACTWGVDTSVTGEYVNTLASINQYFTKYKVTKYSGTSASVLQSLMSGKQIVLFPEQENNTYTHYTSYASALQNFVTNGGVVIFCGSNVAATTRIFDVGLFTGTYGGYLTGGSTLNVVNTTDSLTYGLPSSITAPNATSYYTITNSDNVPLVKYSTYNVVFYRNVGQGKVIHIGDDYFAMDNNFSKIISKAVSMVHGSNSMSYITPTTGTVNAGQSVPAHVVVQTTGQTAGTYSVIINVTGNNPSPNPYPVLVNYTVTGMPNITVPSTCVGFGSIYQNANKTDSITVSNPGCATLNVTSMSVTLPATYSFTPSSFTVAPGASKKVYINFHPTAVGTFPDSLTILNNSSTKKVCLNGTATTSPAMVLSTHSLSVSLSACQASQTVTLTVTDTGGANLTYQVSGAGGGSGPVHVLAITQYVDMTSTGEYNNTLAAINSYFTNYTITQFASGTASQLQTALSGKEVLLIPEQEMYVSGAMTQYASVIQTFANNGGIVIICGTNVSGIHNINDIGLFSSSYMSYSNSGTLNILDTTNFVTKSMPLTMNMQNSTVYHTFTNSPQHLGQYTGYDVIAEKNVGSGKAVFLGFDFFNYDANSSRLISNAVKYPLTGSLPSWVQVSPSTGTVTPGSTQTVSVTFNSGSLPAGTYTFNMVITSNDPLHQKDTVRCTMIVGSNPCVDFTYTAPGNCTGVVNFNDSIVNNATTWQWTFGDGGTSSTANPTHTYTASGTYTVQLIGCNGSGCDTATHVVMISGVGGPIAAVCTPTTQANCCGMGILKVTFNTINFSSPDGSEGYKDNSCTQQTSVLVSTSHQLSVTTGTSYGEYVNAWIDYNNDGTFASSEQVMNNDYTTGVHTVTVTIPASPVLNTPLRMRVISDYNMNSTGACYNPQYGQGEDYTVKITPNTVPPVASYSIVSNNSCSGTVMFADNSTNNPTSWLWNFGDGNASNVQNPTYTYTAAGTYTVTLIATNAYGSSFYNQTVTVNPLLFTISVSGTYVVGATLSFSTSLSGGSPYTWNFGDGYLAGVQNPTHAYSAAGTYVVALTAVSGGCVNTVYDTITIGPNAIASYQLGSSSFSIMPNPFTSQCVLTLNLAENDNVAIELYNPLGQKVRDVLVSQNLSNGKYIYTLNNLSKGVYEIVLQINGVRRAEKIICVGD